jgi:hypothetical protein
MYHKVNRVIVATAIAVLTFNSPVKGELQNVSFLSSNSVDVSSSEKNIPFTYTASESISYITIYFREDTTTGFGRFYGHLSSDESGLFIQVPKFTKPGKWIIEQIDTYPSSGNPTTFARDPYAFYGSWFGETGPKPLPAGIKQLEIQVANTVIDDTAPTLINFSVDMEQLRFDNSGDLYAPCKITVGDNLSGFDSASISFIFSEGSQSTSVGASIYWHGKVSGFTNVYEGKIYFWNPEVNKTYNFESALVKDQSGNALYISSSGQPYSDGYYQINSSPVTGTPFDNLAIQLPESFVGLPRDPAYSSGSSSGGAGASPASGGGSSEKSKKAKKGGGKSSAKKSSEKKDKDVKKSSRKKSDKKSSSGGGDSKKSGGKKKKK